MKFHTFSTTILSIKELLLTFAPAFSEVPSIFDSFPSLGGDELGVFESLLVMVGVFMDEDDFNR